MLKNNGGSYEETVEQYNLIEYEIINMDYTITLSSKWMERSPQYGNGVFNRSCIVGKSSGDKSFKIYSFIFL